jgi:hypothetical protein
MAAPLSTELRNKHMVSQGRSRMRPACWEAAEAGTAAFGLWAASRSTNGCGIRTEPGVGKRRRPPCAAEFPYSRSCSNALRSATSLSARMMRSRSFAAPSR